MDANEKNINTTKVDLKKRIVTAAMKAFTRDGIKAVTMDDIASNLGISKRTLYETFKDKEALLIECVIRHEEEKEAFAAKVITESENVLEVILKFYKLSIDIYQKVNRRFFEDMNKYPRVNEIIRHNHEKNKRDEIAFFMNGVKQGIFRDDVNFEIVNTLVRAQIDFLLSADIVKDYPFIDVYESIALTYLRGISTSKGQKILDEFITNYRKQKR